MAQPTMGISAVAPAAACAANAACASSGVSFSSVMLRMSKFPVPSANKYRPVDDCGFSFSVKTEVTVSHAPLRPSVQAWKVVYGAPMSRSDSDGAPSARLRIRAVSR